MFIRNKYGRFLQARNLFMVGVFVPIFLIINIVLHMRKKEQYQRRWAK
jgi:hypothetical protein